MIPSKLKVVELRAELSSRGLDTKGNKAALVERLEEALRKENPGGFQESSEDKEDDNCQESEKEDQDDSQDQDNNEADDDKVSSVKSSPIKDKEPLQVTQSSIKKESPVKVPERSVDTSAEPMETDAQENHVKQESESPVKNGGTDDNHESKPDVTELEKNVQDSEVDIKPPTDVKREDRKRKRSSGPTPRVMKEDEPTYDQSSVLLSWYDSDLNLCIDNTNLLSAKPMSEAGFGYIWAGGRATYGFTQGKVCYQVKLTENCDVSHLEDEPNPNVLRVGWSIFDTSMQLGEEPNSYGYGGTGKISVDCKFQNYGKPFQVGDVVTAYLDMTGKNVVLSYSVNDEYLDVAWSFPASNLEEKALAPHVLTKNIKFEVNFGQMEEPWFQPVPGYAWASQVPLDQRVLGPTAPAKMSECEMIMMCGLPAAGKTFWANKHAKEHPDKRFNIIGTNALIDKMKVMGLPRKGNYSGRWDLLIEKCTKCLLKLMDIGCHRRRNFILDQTNVYPGAQRRKMRNFEGFIKKAVVLVPTDEEFKERTTKREQEEGKDVPDSAVMEMKANFSLPEKQLFEEVLYVELPEEEAKALVEKYNAEAIEAGYKKNPPPQRNQNKKFKPNNRGRRPNFYNNNRRGGSGGGGPPYHRFNRGIGGGGGGGMGGGMGRNGGGSWHRGPPERSGGWRPESRGMYRSGGMGGGGGGGGMGGGGGGWRGRGPPREMMGGGRRDHGPPPHQRRDTRPPPYHQQDRRQDHRSMSHHNKPSSRGGSGMGRMMDSHSQQQGGGVAGGQWSNYQQSNQQQGGWGQQHSGGWMQQQQGGSQGGWGQTSGGGQWKQQQAQPSMANTASYQAASAYPQQNCQPYQQGYNWQAYQQQQAYWAQQQQQQPQQ